MSTEYEVIKHTEREIVVLEHSSLLDISVLDKHGNYLTTIRDLTPLQLAAIGVELIRVAGYQDEEKVDGLLAKHRHLVEQEARKILGRE